MHDDHDETQHTCPECGESSDYDDAFSNPIAEATGWAVCPHCGHVNVED